jgi:heme A synthase
MSELHRYLGFSIPAGFALLFLWSIYTFIRNRPPHDWFWNLLGILQVIIALQVLIGAILFAVGLRPPAQDLRWLHYLYGGLFPATLLVAAHRIAQRERFREVPWAVFGFVSFINFGLTSRALMTGLGIG